MGSQTDCNEEIFASALSDHSSQQLIKSQILALLKVAGQPLFGNLRM